MEKENTNHKNAYFIIYENITDYCNKTIDNLLKKQGTQY